MWAFRLRNVLNGFNTVKSYGGTLQTRVVLFGPGVRMLAQPIEPRIKDAVDAIRAAGGQFAVCNVTLKGLNLDWHSLYGMQESDIVPSGYLEVGWLGSNGWAIEPAN